VAGLLVLLGVGEVAEGVGEGIVKGLSEGKTSILGLEVIVLNVLKVEVVDLEASREDVVLVDILDEGLHAGLADEFLLAVSALDLGEVPGDTGDEEVGEAVLLHRKWVTLLPSS
jgi:hypothetical protein